MTNPIFSFRVGARIRGGVSAAVVGEELQRIRDAHSGVTPQLVIEQARDSDHPLHPCLTWDDTEAADNWRLKEARDLIKSVRVTYPDSEQSEPAYVNVKPLDPDHSSYYESTREVVQHFSLYESAWRLAKREVDGALKALSDLERIAREQVSDESVARAEAAAEAVRLTRQASEVLDQGH